MRTRKCCGSPISAASRASFDRASTLAWTRARVQLHHLGLDPDEASLFQRLAAHVFYVNPALRAGADTLRRNRAGPFALWAHGVSGDRPIILVEIDDAAHLGLVRQLLRAHEYLTLKNLPVDLVIVNESSTSYVQDLQAAIESAARASQQRLQQGVQPGLGSVYALRSEVMSPESRLALQAAARVALVSRRGTLAEQLDRLEDASAETAPPAGRRYTRPARTTSIPRPQAWSCSMAPAALPPTAPSTRSYSSRGSRRRCRGSMSSASRSSASRCPPPAVAIPGRATAARTPSPPGPTMR